MSDDVTHTTFLGLAIVIEDTEAAQRLFDDAVKDHNPKFSAPVRVHIDGVIKDFTYAEFKKALGFDLDAEPNQFLHWGRIVRGLEKE